MTGPLGNGENDFRFESFDAKQLKPPAEAPPAANGGDELPPVAAPGALTHKRIAFLDVKGVEVAPGSANAATVRTEGMVSLGNGDFRVGATFHHPTKGGKFPAPNSEHAGQIEPNPDPPALAQDGGSDPAAEPPAANGIKPPATKSGGEPAVAPRPSIEFTRMTNARGPMNKRIGFDTALSKFTSKPQANAYAGKMSRVSLQDICAFSPLIEHMPRNTAIALGTLEAGLPDSVTLVLQEDPRNGTPGFAAREKAALSFRPVPTLALCDNDDSGMPPAVRQRLEALGGFVPALTHVCPELAEALYFVRRSTSAGITHTASGTRKEGGWHLFVLVSDGTKIHAFLKDLQLACWTAGLGWVFPGTAGQPLVRSIVDVAVGEASRPVFEAAPSLDLGLVQDPRPVTFHDGNVLDIKTLFDGLDRAASERLIAAEKYRQKPELDRIKAEYCAKEKAEAVARGVLPKDVEAAAKAKLRGLLFPGTLLEFTSKKLGPVDVLEVLTNPEKFDGKECFDPWEGRNWHACAKFYANRMCVHSFFQDNFNFYLKHNAASLRAAILAGPEEEASEILNRLGVAADISHIERRHLLLLAGKRTKAGFYACSAELKDAEKAARQERAEQNRARRAETPVVEGDIVNVGGIEKRLTTLGSLKIRHSTSPSPAYRLHLSAGFPSNSRCGFAAASSRRSRVRGGRRGWKPLLPSGSKGLDGKRAPACLPPRGFLRRRRRRRFL